MVTPSLAILLAQATILKTKVALYACGSAILLNNVDIEMYYFVAFFTIYNNSSSNHHT